MGNIISDITGTTSSAKQQYKHQMNLQKDAQNFAKWQMGNAHQMEVQDLENAGLNAVLSAGGSGASAGVTEGSASAGVSSGDPISMIGNIVGTINNARTTDKQLQEIDSQINKNNAEAYRTLITANPDIEKALAEKEYYIQLAKTAKSQEDINKAQKGLAEWDSRHPILSKILPGSVGAAASVAGTAIMGTALKAGQTARAANSAKTTVRNNYNKKGEFTGSTVTTKK